ncbi:hypothetical protein HQQ81_05505 [Microbacteriaceae bacterium VKM Ac-2854]|nr:hypothetical protein [Microbacteriaceae bacterium VKM Ac-2854]
MGARSDRRRRAAGAANAAFASTFRGTDFLLLLAAVALPAAALCALRAPLPYAAIGFVLAVVAFVVALTAVFRRTARSEAALRRAMQVTDDDLRWDDVHDTASLNPALRRVEDAADPADLERILRPTPEDLGRARSELPSGLHRRAVLMMVVQLTALVVFVTTGVAITVWLVTATVTDSAAAVPFEWLAAAAASAGAAIAFRERSAVSYAAQSAVDDEIRRAARVAQRWSNEPYAGEVLTIAAPNVSIDRSKVRQASRVEADPARRMSSITRSRWIFGAYLAILAVLTVALPMST